MTATATRTSPSRSFWIVGVLALLWNLIGIMTYLMTVTMSQETLDAMPAAERALYMNVPPIVTSAYAIAVFGGTFGSIGLLMRKAWSIPVFIVSLAAIVVQMGHALFMSALLDVQGAGAAVLPLLIVAIAAFLVWYSTAARQRGWIG